MPQPRKAPIELAPKRRARQEDAEARTGGQGLNFDNMPDWLDEAGAMEWSRLAEVYRDTPTRFREGDRQIVAAYCAAFSNFKYACELLTHNDQASSPQYVQAGQMLNRFARELGLSPDSRKRAGIAEDSKPPEDPDRDLLSG